MRPTPELPLPAHFDPSRVGDVWRVPYEDRAREASAWSALHGLRPAAEDAFRLCLLAVDVQNTFCIPDFELFVAGRTGSGAVDDNRRLCEFVYQTPLQDSRFKLMQRKWPHSFSMVRNDE